MSASSVMPAGSKRMLVNASTKACSGTPYWRPWLTAMAKASLSPARVERCCDTRRNSTPGRCDGRGVRGAVADRDGDGLHDPGQGRALLRHPEEQLTRPAVVVLADGDE